MSVRAYKIIHIDQEDEPTFNYWNDDYIIDNLPIQGLNEDGNSIGTIYHDDVEALMAQYGADEAGDSMSKEDRVYYFKVITKLLEDTKDGECSYMFY